MKQSSAVAPVHRYTANLLNEQTIARLIDAAVHAPSAVDTAAMDIHGRAQRPMLIDLARRKNPHDRHHGGEPHADHFRMRLGDPKFHIFYRAAVLVLISAVSDGPVDSNTLCNLLVQVPYTVPGSVVHEMASPKGYVSRIRTVSAGMLEQWKGRALRWRRERLPHEGRVEEK